MRNKILLIEDDKVLGTVLKDYFEDYGLIVHWTTGIQEGLEWYTAYQPDLIILDIILSDGNGFDLIATIRDKDLDIPAILTTGTEMNEVNQIKAYQLGSLNFMPKPIIPQALLALIQHVLRLSPEMRTYKVGSSEILIHSQSVTINQQSYELREKDSLLLSFLLNRKNQIINRELLLKQIWFDDQPKNNNLLDGAVLRLRRVFDSCDDVQIKSVYGAGYMLVDNI